MKNASPTKGPAAGRQSKLRPGANATTKSEKQRAEQITIPTQTLKDSEVRYRRLFEAAQDGILILDAQTGAIEDVNPYLIDMLGYSRAEFLKKKLWEVGAFKDVESSKIEFNILQENGYVRYENLPLRAKGGQLIQVEFVSNVYLAGGKIVIQCNIRNITDRIQAEEVLSDLAAIVESSDDAIIGKTLNGIITSWNSGAQQLYGYSAEEIIGQSISVLIPPDRPDELPEILSRLRRGEKVEHYETIRVGKDGMRLDVSVTISPIKDASGRVVGVSTIARNITERKKMEEELRKAHDELELQVQLRTAALSQSNMLLQTLLDYTPDQIYFKDAGSRFIKNSKAQVMALGLSDPSEVVGKTDFDFFPHAKRSYDEEQEIIRSGKPLVDYEEDVVWPDGHETWVSTTKVPLRDQEDKIIGTFGISRDITDRKRNEEALQKARDELEAFSYSVSHDLRAPLRGIDGWSLALLEDYSGLLDEQGQEYIKRVRSETQHMDQLIDDLLQLSRITRAEMHSVRVDLSARARSIAARLQEGEPQRRVEFIIQDGLSALGDANLLEVMLTNLLSNAFKFTGKTPDARIEFSLMDKEGQRVFFVRDNGAGFDMAYAKKLFGAFQRMHKDSEFPGTGIGLATVQRIINRHGGRVWAESAVNQGATFFFSL